MAGGNSVALFAMLLMSFGSLTFGQQSCGSYQTSVQCGWWDWFYWGGCHDTNCYSSGTFTCWCPGTGSSVSYNIACQKSGGSCTASNGNGKDCNRFTNCATCIGGTSEWSGGGCASCKSGYRLVSGSCTTDINECASQNACAQVCTNTIGSYYCSCNAGYTLQSGGSCSPNSCGSPGSLVNGQLYATNSYLINSYVKYTCNSGLMLVGNAVRTCMLSSQWNGSQPTCVDTCAVVGSTSRTACGQPKTSQSECRQLGCCFIPAAGQPSCFRRQEMLSLTYPGERPSSSARLVLEEFTADGCSFNCSQTSWCKTFVVQRRPADQVEHLTCFLYDQSRTQLATAGRLTYGDQTFELHDPLPNGNAASLPDVQMLYVGCFDVAADDASSAGISRIWTSSYNSPGRCVAACRQQGYTVAGLMNGADCYCSTDNAVNYVNLNSSNCTMPCSGRQDMTCGGHSSSSVYRVPSDDRYVGCYATVKNDADFQALAWSRSDNTSATACISDCLQQGYQYAAVLNGLSCYCGNTFGRYGQVPYDQCRVQCSERRSEECGGPTTLAVYATEIGLLIPSGMQQTTIFRNLYSTNTRGVEIPLRLFTNYPQLKTIATPRCTFIATDTVESPTPSAGCSGCYAACGDVTRLDTAGQIQYGGSDQIVRAFYIDLSQLTTLVTADAQRVFVYAQTVVISADLQFPFSVQIRARQVVIDRGSASRIRVNATTSSSSTLDLNFSDRLAYGVRPDPMFTKQSFMCARILMDAGDQNSVNTAWAILDDLARSDASCADAEQCSWLYAIRMFNSYMSGIERQSVRFVPYYSKAYFTNQLQLYFDQVTLYKTDFATLLSSSTSRADYLATVDSMTGIYVASSVFDAQSSLSAALVALGTSNSSFHRLQDQYNAARQTVFSAGNVFVNRVKRQIDEVLSVLGVVKDVVTFIIDIGNSYRDRVVAENRRRQAEAVAREVQTVLDVELSDLAVGLCSVDSTAGQLVRFFGVADDIVANLAKQNQTGFDYAKYADDIDAVIAMKDTVVQWQNLKNNVQIILQHPNVNAIQGSADYLLAVLDFSNWGAALTSAAIEYAELLRDAVQKRYTLSSKLAQQQRYSQNVADLRAGVITQQLMTAAMNEQLQDVRIDINNALLFFCQAYFFETLSECSSDTRPSFGGTLSQLLLKINKALQTSLLTGDSTPSTVSRLVTITDDDCVSCPIQTFRQTGVLYYQLTVDNPALTDLSTYRVRTLFLEFVGAKKNVSTGNEVLKVLIDSSGIFQGKEPGAVYDFVTTPRSLAYEYDVVSGDISLCADVSATNRNTVQHVTPYTVWLVRLSSRSRDIDFSQLSAIKMRFLGSAVNAELNSLASPGAAYNPCT